VFEICKRSLTVQHPCSSCHPRSRDWHVDPTGTTGKEPLKRCIC